MDKNAIKKYAVWARRELISRVSQKALQYGIAEENIVPADAATVNGVVLSNEEKKQRRALIEKINDKGYQQVMEEVAYTWFNRFIALRFMEVNGYLPSHVRVFTDDENNFKPQILAEAINLDFDGLNMDKVYELKDANDNEALFKYLLIVQCNALNPIMPRMFQKISDYTELLFPDNLLREGSVVQQMIELIPEEDWKDAVQIIGWLYQYYNSEKKDEVFAALKKNVKITKENVPAATQLFTPDWIVRYMVENSLGRLWVEGHPSDELKAGWKYYLEEAEQEPEVQIQLDAIRSEYAAITPEQIKCIDPCCGSGHILAYMFDVLVQIYEAYGYTAREAVRSIIENNIYGLDIDERAAQLAYFSVMMKARQYDRRFLNRKDEDINPDVPQPHVHVIIESNGIDAYALDYFVNGDAKLKAAMNSIMTEMRDAKEYGSILNITPVDFTALYARLDEVRDDINMSRENVLNDILPVVEVAELLCQQYEIVVTNPPYMGLSGMGSKLSEFVKDKYFDSKSDLGTVFMERCLEFTKKNGYVSIINQNAWMFLSSYLAVRKKVMLYMMESLLHLGARAFDEISGEVVQTVAFVMRKNSVSKYIAPYCRLVNEIGESNKRKAFFENKRYNVAMEMFEKLPGTPFAYWLDEALLSAFEKKPRVLNYAETKTGMGTSDNDRFLRLWYECDYNTIMFGCLNLDMAKVSKKKWFPYNKGGGYRRWYGNFEYVVNWENDGYEVKEYAAKLYKSYSRTIKNIDAYFKRCLAWSDIATGLFSMRLVPDGFIFDGCSPSLYCDDDNRLYMLGFLNSFITQDVMEVLSPTIHFNSGSVSNIPFVLDKERKNRVEELVAQCVTISRIDWDENEVSWDFSSHPLVNRGKIKSHYDKWKEQKSEQIQILIKNEIEINKIFSEIFGIEWLPDYEKIHESISVRVKSETEMVRSLISYFVGCMFGRYSTDVEGLAFAGGEWDASKYVTFKADSDNIIPICDDEYFEDDIVGRFVKFIEVVYGKETLEENLKFIADALGGTGQPREAIRKYFLTEFYVDHLKTYQKRPIYWLFDSGKKNGFKALVYMNRYQPDTIARMRTDYVHEQQSRYRTAIADLEQRIVSASTSERVKLNKKLKTMKDQAVEIQGYEEKIHHLADQYISIDLDDGVKVNYAKFQEVLAKIK